MAETKEMTFNELAQLERDIQLGNPEEVRLPDGRTVAEAQRENAERDTVSRREQVEQTKADMRRQANTNLTEQRFSVSVSETGQIITSPIQDKPPQLHTSDAGVIPLTSVGAAIVVEPVVEPEEPKVKSRARVAPAEPPQEL
jgi:hypothetical protein